MKIHQTSLDPLFLFLIRINIGLGVGDEHHFLHHHSPDLPSQFSFQLNEKGQRCLVYTKDNVTKTNDEV